MCTTSTFHKNILIAFFCSINLLRHLSFLYYFVIVRGTVYSVYGTKVSERARAFSLQLAACIRKSLWWSNRFNTQRRCMNNSVLKMHLNRIACNNKSINLYCTSLHKKSRLKSMGSESYGRCEQAINICLSFFFPYFQFAVQQKGNVYKYKHTAIDETKWEVKKINKLRIRTFTVVNRTAHVYFCA